MTNVSGFEKLAAMYREVTEATLHRLKLELRLVEYTDGDDDADRDGKIFTAELAEAALIFGIRNLQRAMLNSDIDQAALCDLVETGVRETTEVILKSLSDLLKMILNNDLRCEVGRVLSLRHLITFYAREDAARRHQSHWLQHDDRRRLKHFVNSLALKRFERGRLDSATYDTDMENSEGPGEVCPICLSSRLSGQRVITLSCSHRFHELCATTALQTEPRCPICLKFFLINL